MKVTSEYNLAVLYPELIKGWHPTKNGDLTPYDVSPYSEETVWWICEKGDIWDTSIKNRTLGYECPYCAGKKANERNCLATIYPELAKEWHLTFNGNKRPQDFLPRSGKKVWWLCARGHPWIARISDRTLGTGCPKCKPNRDKA